jgi:hypothetical protein
VAYVIASHHEDVRLRNVRGVIGDSLEVFRDANGSQSRVHVARVLGHPGGHGRDDGCTTPVDVVIASEDAVGLNVIAAHERIQREVKHVERRAGHDSELVDHHALGLTAIFHCPFGDIHGFVADSLEIRNQPKCRGEKPQVIGDGLTQRKNAHDERVDLELVSIDLGVERDHLMHHVRGSLPEAVECKLDNALATSPHCEQVRPQFPQLGLEIPAAMFWRHPAHEEMVPRRKLPRDKGERQLCLHTRPLVEDVVPVVYGREAKEASSLLECDSEGRTGRRVDENSETNCPAAVNSTISLGRSGSKLTASPWAEMRSPLSARTSPSGPCRCVASRQTGFANPETFDNG